MANFVVTGICALAAASLAMSACEPKRWIAPDASDAPVVAGMVTVRVIAPDGGEQLTAAEQALVRWTGEDRANRTLRYDVELADDTGPVRMLGTGIELASGQTGELAWSPIGVPVPTQYRIRIRATSPDGDSASDDSNATFTVSPPAQGLSFARDIQPIFTARCTTQFCHNTQSQVAVLHLAAGAAYDQLVNVPSRENPCTSYMRVRPGQPGQSYLVFKLQGSGPCLYGVRMPKDAVPLTGAQITMIRDWITAGALNN